ncbi:MAG: PIN domain-containing protein [Chloroflexi bacterium]|nr:PIN domain-containing protein [Chloroflexota bacterium]
MAKKIYLDNCSLQRPLDSKTQIRLILEADAILGILTLVESKTIELIASDVLLTEINRQPNFTRQEYGLEVLAKATTFVRFNARVERRAGELQMFGIKPLDALHLASAEEAQADYFCTCDDRLLKKAKAIPNLNTRVVSPIELAEEVDR